jgi:hypothetical protein
MIDVEVKLKNGHIFTIPFVEESLQELLSQMNNGVNEDWDLGGIEVKTSDIKSVDIIEELFMDKEFNILQNQLSTGGIHAFVGFNEVIDEFDHIDCEEFELILKFLLDKINKRRMIINGQ